MAGPAFPLRKTGEVRRLLQAGIVAVGLLALAGCGSSGGSSSGSGGAVGGAETAPGATAESTSSSVGRGHGTSKREEVTLSVPSALAGGTLESPHQVEVPAGWTASVWARPEGARMMAATPEGNLLVSEPGNGVVLELAGGDVAERPGHATGLQHGTPPGRGTPVAPSWSRP